MRKNNIFKNASIVFVGSVISQLFGLLFVIVASRVLTKADYGYFSYLISLGMFLGTIVSGGVPIAVTRYIAHKPSLERKYVENGLLILLLMFIVVSIASLFVIWPVWEPLVLVLTFSIVNFYLAILRGRGNFKLFSIVSSGRNIIKFILLVILFYIGLITKYTIFWVYALAGILVVIIVEYFYSNKLFSIPHYDVYIFKEIFKFSIPLIIMTTSYSLTNNIGIYILNFNMGYEAVAIFKNALVLQMVYGFISGAIGVVLLPKISSITSISSIRKTFKTSLFLLISLESIIFMSALLVGREIIILLFSSKYEEVFPLFIIMSIGTIAYSLERAAFSSLWNGIGKPNITMLSSIVAGILITILSFIFISLYGIMGAAYGYALGFLLAVSSVDIPFFIYHMRKGDLKHTSKNISY